MHNLKIQKIKMKTSWATSISQPCQSSGRITKKISSIGSRNWHSPTKLGREASSLIG